jgi:predicted PurR-regulated permease PerM
MDLKLSARQQATVATAITLLATVVIAVATVGFFWLIGAFFNRFSGVILPLAVAGVGALVFRPYYEWLCAKLRFPALALVAMFASAIVPIVFFAWFFGSIVVEQVDGLIDQAPLLREKAKVWIEARSPEIVAFFEQDPYGQKLKAALEDSSTGLVTALQKVGGGLFSAGAGVLSFIFSLFGWAVAPVYFVFFLGMKGRVGNVDDLLPFLKPSTRQDVVYLVREFVAIVVSFFRGQLIIAVLQALCYAVAFQLVGLRYGFVIGLLTGLLNIVPFLGSMLGLGIGLPTAFFQEGGGPGRILALLIAFAIVQLIEGYVLTPKIMGDRTGLHPMAIMVAIFFWGSALSGILGMILAIPLTAFLVVFWRLARDKYVRELV